MNYVINAIEGFFLFVLVLLSGIVFAVQAAIAIVFYAISVGLAYIAFGVAFIAYSLKKWIN